VTIQATSSGIVESKVHLHPWLNYPMTFEHSAITWAIQVRSIYYRWPYALKGCLGRSYVLSMTLMCSILNRYGIYLTLWDRLATKDPQLHPSSEPFLFRYVELSGDA
jgi:uncharacterized membrane protein